MTNQIRRAVVIGLAAASLSWAPARAQQPEPGLAQVFEEARTQLEEIGKRTYELEKRVPNELDTAEEDRRTRTLAEKAGLGEIRIEWAKGAERVALADGRPSSLELHRFEVSGRSHFILFHAFLVQRSSFNRLMELDRLHLLAEPDGGVRFTARFALPLYAPLPPEEHPDWKSPEDMVRKEVVARQLYVKALEDLTARSNPPRLTGGLVAFGNGMGNRTLGLTEVRLEGQDAVLSGSVPSTAQDRLRAALEKAGFHVKDLKTSPAGGCVTFTAETGLDPAGPEGEYEAGMNFFRTRPACD